MAFKKGDPKPPNSGIQKGSTRKIFGRPVLETCLERGIHPIEKLLDLFQETDRDDLKVKILLEIASYIYAKQRAVVHSGEITQQQQISPEQLSTLVELAKSFKSDDAK